MVPVAGNHAERSDESDDAVGCHRLHALCTCHCDGEFAALGRCTADCQLVGVCVRCQSFSQSFHRCHSAHFVPFINNILYGLTFHDFLRRVGSDTSQLYFLRYDDISRNAIELESPEIGCIVIIAYIYVVGRNEFQVGFGSFLLRQMSGGCEAHDRCALVLQHRALLQPCEIVFRQRPVAFSWSHKVGHGQREELARIVAAHRLGAIGRFLPLLIWIASIESCPRVELCVGHHRALLVGRQKFMVAHAFVAGSPPSHAVAYGHASIFEDCGEPVVEFISPCRAVDDIHALVGIVLVKALVQVVERHAVCHDMSAERLVEGRPTAGASTTQFESVAILPLTAIGQVSGMVSPAGIDDNGMVYHIQVPVVVAVGPCPASVKLCARSREEFACEPVGITSIVGAVVASQVPVVVGVAIYDLVVSAELVAGVELRCASGQIFCLLDTEVLIHSYLQSGVIVVVEDTPLYDVVRPLPLHAIILGIA